MSGLMWRWFKPAETLADFVSGFDDVGVTSMTTPAAIHCWPREAHRTVSAAIMALTTFYPDLAGTWTVPFTRVVSVHRLVYKQHCLYWPWCSTVGIAKTCPGTLSNRVEASAQ